MQDPPEVAYQLPIEGISSVSLIGLFLHMLIIRWGVRNGLICEPKCEECAASKKIDDIYYEDALVIPKFVQCTLHECEDNKDGYPCKNATCT